MRSRMHQSSAVQSELRDAVALRVVSAIVLVTSLVIVGFTVWHLYDVVKSAQWQRQACKWPQVPAEIIQVAERRVETRHGFERIERSCEFRYDFRGQCYSNETYSLTVSLLEIGTWQAELFDRLNSAQADRCPVPCYVDSHHPQRAVLDRNFHAPDFCFTVWLVFAGLGGGLSLLGCGAHGMRMAALRRRLIQDYPRQPWRWEQGIHDGVIKPWLQAAHAWGAAGIWATVGGVPLAVIVMPTLIQSGGGIEAWFLTVAGIGMTVGLLWKAVRIALPRWWLRRSVLELDSMPVRLGQDVAGWLDLAPLKIRTDSAVVWLENGGKAVAMGRAWRVGRSDGYGILQWRVAVPTLDASAHVAKKVEWFLVVRPKSRWLRAEVRFALPISADAFSDSNLTGAVIIDELDSWTPRLKIRGPEEIRDLSSQQ